ncbi:serine hydrolase [Portibacter lacus]|uniref:Serine hydrolase n=1 Tax=Portibacter lacus TaxID=1099794 RepID=A0AA37WFV7_9BACT|nr:serine hydrolase [Portibacter lacus]GLR17310.1 hypothetical protein GCM10007940_19250 [Portibacter lacus]
MKNILLLVVFTITSQFIFNPSSIAQSNTDEISHLLDLYHDNDQFNGSVLVAEKGQVVYKGGKGMANMEWGIKNDADTKHRLGSITKQFTAMIVMQLMEEGKVKLDAPITTYIPNYPKVNGDQITLHHLLTHTSGIPNYTSFAGFFKNESRNTYSPEEFLVFFADSTLNFEPGSEFEYSNSGYFLLGYIIEQVAQDSYENELEKRIFDPLGMKDTGYDHHGTILKNRATGYEREGMKFVNSPYLDMSIPYAAGSLYSTAEDLYLWDRALYTEKLISAETKTLMYGAHADAWGGAYGYGWSIADRDGELEIGHGGGINGFNTLISRYPEQDQVVILLNNTGGANLSGITKGIKAILAGKDYDIPKKSLAKAVNQAINAAGVDNGIRLFQELKNSDDYALEEQEMNALGYDLMQSGNIAGALKIFKLNVDEFPESWNVYDSYAEALMVSGDDEGAIKNYTRSVKMNPANTSGIKFLKDLGADTKSLESKVEIDDAMLSSYVGEYEIQPGFILSITKNGSQLSGQATGQGAAEIYPKSETEFYLKVVNAQIVFNKNAAGEVESLTLIQGGNEMVSKKIK